MNVLEMLPTYEDYLRHERRFSTGTVEAYKSDLRDLGQHVDCDVVHITPDMMRGFMQVLSKRGLTAATIQRKFAAYTTFWRWLRHKEIVDRVVTETLIMPKVEHVLPAWLSASELMTFALTPDYSDPARLASRNALAWKLLAWLGLRRSELLNLQIRDVLIEARVLVIRKTKTRRDRELPIPENLIDALKAQIGDRRDGFVLCGLHGGRWSNQLFAQAFTRHIKACGLSERGIHPHSIRHSVATHLIEKGVKVTDVQQLLGHADIKTTMEYVHRESTRLRAALSNHILNFKE